MSNSTRGASPSSWRHKRKRCAGSVKFDTRWPSCFKRCADCGIIPGPQPAEAQSPTDRLLRDYGRFLIQERGLSQATLDNYLPVARRFLTNAFGVKPVQLDQLAVGDVNRFILREKSTFSPKRVQLTTSALRSFLGFLYLRGRLRTPLAASVPTVATWRLSELPQFLEPRQVQQLLQSCDRQQPLWAA